MPVLSVIFGVRSDGAPCLPQRSSRATHERLPACYSRRPRKRAPKRGDNLYAQSGMLAVENGPQDVENATQNGEDVEGPRQGRQEAQVTEADFGPSRQRRSAPRPTVAHTRQSPRQNDEGARELPLTVIVAQAALAQRGRAPVCRGDDGGSRPPGGSSTDAPAR